MNYHCDGYLIGSNPSKTGGGFTVFTEEGLVHTEKILKEGMTNSETELLSVFHAAQSAEMYDGIITDSKCMLYWLNRKHLKRKKRGRKDLDHIKLQTIELIENKFLELRWVPREENLAGIYNDTVLVRESG